MQRLLGTHLGHTVIYTMCTVLQSRSDSHRERGFNIHHRAHREDVLLLRGAVFYISMSLWGVKRVDTLSLPFTAVLPAIHQVNSPLSLSLSLSLSHVVLSARPQGVVTHWWCTRWLSLSCGW